MQVRSDGQEDLEPIRGALRWDHGCQMAGVGKAEPAQGCGEDRDAGRLEEILQGKQIGLCRVAMNDQKIDAALAVVRENLKQFLTCNKTVGKYAITIEVNVSQGALCGIYIVKNSREKVQ